MALTDEEKTGLSPEEIAAIEETETEEDLQTVEEEPPEGEKSEEQKPEEVKPEEQVAAEQPREEKKEEVKEQARPIYPPMFVPQYKVEDITEIEGALKTAKEQLTEGEIDLDEYNALRDELRSRQIKAEIINELNIQTPEQAWAAEQNAFFNRPDNQFFRQHPMWYGALNETIKVMDKNPNFAGISGFEALEMAKKYVIDELGMPKLGQAEETPQQEKPQATPAAPKVEKPPSKKETVQIPKTLATAPSAEANEAETKDEFAFLDGLTGEELEMAIAKLTPEQMRRYERV